MWFKVLLFLLLATPLWAGLPPTRILDEGTDKGVAFKFDCVGAGIVCSQSGVTGTLTVGTGAGGDSVSVDGVAVTDPNFASTGDVDFVDTANVVTGTVVSVRPAAENSIEALLDLQDLQGAVTDAQVPNTITIDLATTATTANAGDSATGFFPSGTLEEGLLPDSATVTGWALGDSTATTLTTPTIIGGTTTTSDLNLKTTSGVGAAGADMHFLVGNNGATEAMTILNSGNVGIGTAAPLAPLQVNGHVVIGNPATFDASETLIISGGSSTLGSIRFRTDASTGSTTMGASGASFNGTNAGDYGFRGQALHFGTSSTPSLSINTAGNVGIGTTAPDKKLEINSATGVTLRLTYNDANGTAANYVDQEVSATGDLTITPSGGDVAIVGNITGTNLSGTNTGDNTVATSGDSATSFFASGTLEVAIGGTGTTTSTGTGAVVLGTSPTFTTSITATNLIVDAHLATTESINLPVYSAKLTGAFVVRTPTSGDASTQGAQIDAGDGNWRLLFDATTDEAAVWQFRLPDYWAAHGEVNIAYTMTSGTADKVEFEVDVMCVSDGDAADVGTASFAGVAVGSATVPGTVGYPDEISVTVTDDSCAAGDMMWIYLSTDADDITNDNATGDREVIGLEYEFTR